MVELRKLLLAGMAAGLAVSPVMAWEFGISDNGDIFWTVAEDFSGEASLAFYCSLSVPSAIQVQIGIEQSGPDGPVPVELGFEVAGHSFGPIAATAESVEGALAVSTRDAAGIGEAARAIYAERASVMLTYYENAWRFDGGDYSEDFGAMLDACG